MPILGMLLGALISAYIFYVSVRIVLKFSPAFSQCVIAALVIIGINKLVYYFAGVAAEDLHIDSDDAISAIIFFGGNLAVVFIICTFVCSRIIKDNAGMLLCIKDSAKVNLLSIPLFCLLLYVMATITQLYFNFKNEIITFFNL